MPSVYSNPLTITGQFPFCSLPLRLDSYRGCSFSCSYCFARQRGGNTPEASIAPADPAYVSRLLDRAFVEGEKFGPLYQMIHRRVPIHFGGMSDPFQPAERKWQVSLKMLQSLSRYSYPTVISTRGTLVSLPEYMTLLQKMRNVVVQFSMSTIDDSKAAVVEPHATRPSRMLETMETLSAAGVAVTCRWQPFIPGFSDNTAVFMKSVASAGARHVALEHLKVPVERQLGRDAGSDLIKNAQINYRQKNAHKDGREYVLPALMKIERVLEVRDYCRLYQIGFGAADNEFQYLSDGEACCSGVDLINDGFGNVFKFTIANAIRRSRGKEILIDRILDEWRPEGSVDRYLNSRSRLGKRLGVAGSITDHILYRWNNNAANNSPSSFFGVVPKEDADGDEPAIYQWSDDARLVSAAM